MPGYLQRKYFYSSFSTFTVVLVLQKCTLILREIRGDTTNSIFGRVGVLYIVEKEGDENGDSPMVNRGINWEFICCCTLLIQLYYESQQRTSCSRH